MNKLSSKKLITNFLNSCSQEHWETIPTLDAKERLELRLSYVNRLLGEDVNGDNAAQMFGLNFWYFDDSWDPHDKSEHNPWLNNDKNSIMYGHPLDISELQKDLGNNGAIIADWIMCTARLCHDLGNCYTFDLRTIIPLYNATGDWAIKNTLCNVHFIKFVNSSPYRRIAAYILRIALNYNHKTYRFKGKAFDEIFLSHISLWQELRGRKISYDDYTTEIMRMIAISKIY